MSVSLIVNEELHGLELHFSAKPDQNILTNLKENGFRWSKRGFWYTKQSEKAFNIANSLVNGVIEEVKTIVNKSTKNNMSLWEATQWTELEGINRDRDNKVMAKEMKQHVSKRFPQCKFSVTSKGWNSINLSIVSSPYEKESIYLAAIREYCKQLINSYKYCTCYDPYGDYGSSYNFYGYAEISWQYEQTEVTEQIKNEMADFDIKLSEYEKAEEERKHQEFLEWQKQEEIKNAEYNKRMEEEKKQIENIYNSVEVKELEENNQYFINGSEFAHLNKNNTLDQYKEEVLKGEFELNNVKVTKEIHFNNLEALNNFSNLLLHDFTFLEGTGGSYTDDNRINSMTDFYNIDEEERNSVKWNVYGVAIYFNNNLQFVVDTQGHNYSCYVGLTDNATIQKSITAEQTLTNEELTVLKDQADMLETISADVIQELNINQTWNNDNWIEYKEAMKEQLTDYEFKLTKRIIQQLEIEELKTAMYKLLIEVDGIQEQFKKADIQQGEKLTLFYISDFGSIVTNRMTFDSVTNTKYAQYDNAIKLTYKPENKRKLYYQHFYSTILVFKGWHTLPETILNNVEEKNGYIITRSKYSSCDKKQYDEILNYFEQQEIKPIVNTYKPTF